MSISTEISAPTWISLLTRYGISKFGKFFLNDTVVPMVLVDTAVSIPTTNLPALFGVPSSAGELVAPAVNTRLADTGALAAGNWIVMALVSHEEGVNGNTFRFRRRNAADAADIWSLRYRIGNYAGVVEPGILGPWRFSIAAGERFVIENVLVGGAGVVYQAQLFVTAG